MGELGAERDDLAARLWEAEGLAAAIGDELCAAAFDDGEPQPPRPARSPNALWHRTQASRESLDSRLCRGLSFCRTCAFTAEVVETAAPLI